jgi:hypothetical protein
VVTQDPGTGRRNLGHPHPSKMKIDLSERRGTQDPGTKNRNLGHPPKTRPILSAEGSERMGRPCLLVADGDSQLR